MSVKNIVVIVDSIDVNDSSGSKANVALIKNLLAIGYQITVLHYTRKNICIEGVTCIVIPERRKSFLYFISGIQRLLQRHLKVNFAKYLEPIFGFSFTFFNDVNSIRASILNQDLTGADLILTLSKAASFRPHYAVNKMPEIHNKWLAYIHDPYPFSCYPDPYRWVEPSDALKMKFFQGVTNNAKVTVFPSLLLKDWMGRFFDNCNRTGIVIPHQKINIENHVVAFPDFFDVAKFNLLHAGGLIGARNPKGLLKGLCLFFENNPSARNDVRLIFVGNTTGFTSILKDFKNEIPELVIKHNGLPFEMVYKMQQQVSVNIILEAQSVISPFLPGKFPHCVSANKPILHLGPNNSEVKRLLGSNYPFWAEIDDAYRISNIIEELYLLWKKNPNDLLLNRQDLDFYLSEKYLSEIMNKLVV